MEAGGRRWKWREVDGTLSGCVEASGSSTKLTPGTAFWNASTLRPLWKFPLASTSTQSEPSMQEHGSFHLLPIRFQLLPSTHILLSFGFHSTSEASIRLLKFLLDFHSTSAIIYLQAERDVWTSKGS